MLRLRPKKQEPEDELEIGKARFKIAALQAAEVPAELIRRHPWATVLGTTAVAVAAGAVLGKRPVKVEAHYDGKSGHKAPPPPKESKVNWVGPLINMASNLVQAYITKQMSDAHEATAKHATAQADNSTPPAGH